MYPAIAVEATTATHNCKFFTCAIDGGAADGAAGCVIVISIRPGFIAAQHVPLGRQHQVHRSLRIIRSRHTCAWKTCEMPGKSVALSKCFFNSQYISVRSNAAKSTAEEARSSWQNPPSTRSYLVRIACLYPVESAIRV